MPDLLIYGANGYTGELLSERAVEIGLAPILAGRSEEGVRALAARLRLPSRVFALHSPAGLREGIAGAAVVLHAAGPFSATSRPMVDACLAAGAHYVDVTGEIAVLEAVAARDAEAREAGLMLLPGAGFDVVPTDCLAAHLKRRLPGATRLRLAVAVSGGVSRGTARTVVEGMGRDTLVRRAGRIVDLPEAARWEVDFGAGPRPVLGRSWGDVATAWRSTGIPEIDVFFALNRRLERVATLPRTVKRLLASRVARRLVHGLIRRRPPGPTPEQRARGRSVIVGHAWDDQGMHVASRLQTVEAYTLTAWTAVEIARRALSNEAVPGYQTPSTAYGPDFVLSFERTVRQDL